MPRRTTARRAAWTVALLGAAAWLAVAGAVRADEVGEKAAERAREACRELLRDRGFKDIDFGDMNSRDEGNKVVVEIAAKRKGNERDVTCVYDRDEGEAQLAD